VSLKDRFETPDDLIGALLSQRIVQGSQSVAEEIARDGVLIEYSEGQNIIEQGASDRDLIFLLVGKSQVVVNGVRLYIREHGVAVGEMSAVNPHVSRSATIEAAEPVVAWKISHTRLADIGKQHPDIWRLLAIELAGRLEQRNRFVNRVNLKPRLFLICSSEALAIARAIRVGVEHHAQVVIWSDDKIFPPGTYAIEDLEYEVNEADFGIALAEPDDLVLSRHRTSAAPRDNVIFELGFFMSRLGRRRTILLVPRVIDVKLPSDFKGLMPISYEKGTSAKGLSIALGPTIDRICSLIAELGVRASLTLAR
jgi:CRP/FNR family cyclic AMP-dependent transcriptional regulator